MIAPGSTIVINLGLKIKCITVELGTAACERTKRDERVIPCYVFFCVSEASQVPMGNLLTEREAWFLQQDSEHL